MPQPVVVIGHSLAAPENRLAFEGGDTEVVQIVPAIWRSPGSTHRYRTDETPKIRPLKVTFSGHNSLFLYRGLGACLQAARPSLIYAWEEPWSLAAWQVMRQARRLGIPWIFFSAENRPKALPAPFRRLCRSVYASAAAAITPSDAIAATLRQHGYGGPIHVIPLWVPSRPLLRPSPQPRLVFVGRFVALKRLDLLLRALVHMPGIPLRLIGDGPEEPALRSLAKRLGLEARVEFFGHRPNATLHLALEGCSLLTLLTEDTPRQAEQFGKAVLDAVLSGLPVAVHPGGHLGHWTREIATVRPVDCSNPEVLASDLLRLLQHPPSPELLASSRQKAQERYGPQAAALRFAAAFSDTLNQYPSPACKRERPERS